tara:strand:+ start:647 stop:793 length:147 start_codon:yes stop_codon:yes gene_type:complete
MPDDAFSKLSEIIGAVPILVCNVFTSIGASSDDDFLSRPKILVASARS